ncbi:MAG: hypothetical protein LBU06_03830 [Desulfovibrio sp.]|jgi:chromosome segregation ATPase|nr:hypothetical protein [Desulfovibrio sp.]
MKNPTLGHSQEAAPMEQVRDLLFGSQLKDMEIRFQRQEERFTREIGDLRDAIKSRMDSLENFMKSENASLLSRLQKEEAERESALKDELRERSDAIKTERHERFEAIKAEQRERAEALTQLTKELAGTADAFERKITKVSTTLDETERELRNLLLSETGALAAKTEERYQDALKVISNTAAQIRYDMVYRSSLSSMLTEVAVKLSGQWTMDMGQLLPGDSPVIDPGVPPDESQHG